MRSNVHDVCRTKWLHKGVQRALNTIVRKKIKNKREERRSFNGPTLFYIENSTVHSFFFFT